MDSRHRQLLRVANAIQTRLRRQAEPPLTEMGSVLAQLCAQLEHLKKTARTLAHCRQRGWHLAARQFVQDLRYRLPALANEATRADRIIRTPREVALSLSQIYAELVQAEEEFDGLDYRGRDGLLVATTKSITLEDVRLGRFEIQLVLDRLGTPNHYEALHIVALDPNPASTDERVTHPHVSSERLCAGDASAPLNAALAAGRICDVFVLVRSVLETYNPGSPFIALDSWDGTDCADCGDCISTDNSFYCDGCEQSFCDDCYSYCRSCDKSLCRGCLSKCPACDEYTCPSCLEACKKCGTRICSNCREDELCPDCKEKEPDDEGTHDDEADAGAGVEEAGASVAVAG